MLTDTLYIFSKVCDSTFCKLLLNKFTCSINLRKTIQNKPFIYCYFNNSHLTVQINRTLESTKENMYAPMDLDEKNK